jgi:hypothetical protein
MPARVTVADEIEAAAATAIVFTAALFLARFCFAMATTSLWNDEIYSNVFFSRHGPLHVATTYETNNHPLFNLLSSLLPGRASLEPFRARIVSFAAVLALLGAVLAFFRRRRLFLAGALVFQLVAVHRELLDLTLQARGYGLLVLLAAVVSWGVLAVVEGERRRGLWALGVATVLGAYAVPSFVVWGGAALALLFFLEPRRDAGVAALAVAGGVLLLYAPVLPKLLHEMRMYETWFGKSYVGLAAVRETVLVYLLPGAPGSALAWLWTLLVAALLAGALVALVHEGRHAAAPAILLGASALFIGVCLVQKTPPARTTAFLALPVFLSAVWLAIGKPSRRASIRAGFAVAAAAFLGPLNVDAARSFTFVPIESYHDSTRAAASLLARGFPLHVLLAPHLVDPPSDPAHAVRPELDAERFSRGAIAVLDDDYRGPERFDGSRLAPAAVALRFPQRRGGFQALWIAPPAVRHLAGLSISGVDVPLATLVDGDPKTGIPAPEGTAAVEIRLDSGPET